MKNLRNLIVAFILVGGSSLFGTECCCQEGSPTKRECCDETLREYEAEAIAILVLLEEIRSEQRTLLAKACLCRGTEEPVPGRYYIFDGKKYPYDPIEKISQCDFPGCRYKKSSIAYLKTHLRRHRTTTAPESDIFCCICNGRIEHLFTHMPLHKCSCGYIPQTLEEYKHCPNPECDDPIRVKDEQDS